MATQLLVRPIPTMDSVVGIAQRAVSFPFEVVDFWQSGTFNVSRAAEIARLANISYALGDASFLDYDNNERHIFSWRRTNLEQIHDLAANGVFIVATFGQLQQFSALDARGQVVQRLREFQRAIHSEYELDIIANGSNSAKQQPLSARSAVALQRYPALAQIVRSAATQSPDRPPMVDQLAACVFVRTGTRPPYMARTCSATKTHQDIADMSMLAIHPCVQSQGISLNILEQAFVVAGLSWWYLQWACNTRFSTYDESVLLLNFCRRCWFRSCALRCPRL